MGTNDRLQITAQITSDRFKVTLWHRGWISVTPLAYVEALKDLTPINVLLEGNTTINLALNNQEVFQARKATGSITIARDESTYTETIRWISEKKLPVQVHFNLQPLNFHQIKEGNVLGCPIRPHSTLRWIAYWPEEIQDHEVEVMLSEIFEELKNIAEARDSYIKWVTMNDAGCEQDVFGGYGTKSQEFLRRVRKEYDPDKVFQCLQNGGFLLSGSE